MNSPFHDRVAIVTGSATGIGRQTALTLAAEGATVVIADINETEGRACQDQIVALGQTATLIYTDVTDEGNIQATLQETLALYGKLDFLVNNAGATSRKLIKDTSRQDWQNTLDLNLSSLFLFSKRAYPYLEKQGGAAIVNIASLHAFATVSGLSAYAASKAGILAFTRSQAIEFAPEVRINAVVPGLIETETWLKSVDNVEAAREHRLPFHPLERLGKPEDIAHAVAFLLSGKASFITGTSLIVDGGLSTQLYRGDS